VSMIVEAEREGKIHPEKLCSSNRLAEYRHRSCVRRRGQGIQTGSDHARTMSLERRVLLLAFGAEIVLTPGPRGMTGAISKRKRFWRTLPAATCCQQFDNAANPKIHFETTGPEIGTTPMGASTF